MNLGLLLLTLVLTLAACTQPISDSTLADIPGVEVSKTVVKVGEPVKVTLTGGFELEAGSNRPPDVLYGFRLGACFSDYEGASKVFHGGACVQNLPLPEPITLMDGTSYVKSFGDLVIEPGEHKRVNHTFSFTSNSPGDVVIEAAYQNQFEGGEPFTIGRGDAVKVVFE